MDQRKLATAAAKGVFIYSLITWAFIIYQIHYDPNIIKYHYILATLVPIREDFVAVISFALSGLAFIAWEYLRSTSAAHEA